MKRHLARIQFSVLFLAAQALFAQQPTDGQTPRRIDEAMVETLLIANNFGYQSAKIAYEQAKRERNSVWNNLFPSLSGTVGVSNGNKGLTSHASSNSTSGEWVTSIGFAASLNISAWVEMSIFQTFKDYDAGKMSFAAAKKSALDSGKKLFYSLILQRENLNNTAESLDLTRRNYQQAQANFNNGLSQRLDMLNAQVQYQNSQNTYQQALTAYEGNLLSFKQLIGIDVHQPIELDGQITVQPARFNAQDLASRYAGNSYTFKETEAKLASLRWQTIQQHLNLVSPFVQLDYNLNRVNYNKNGNLYPSMVTNGQNPNMWKDTASVTIGVKAQFDGMLPWSKTGISLWELRDSYKISKMSMENDKITNEVEIINQANKLNDIQGRMAVLENAANVSQQALQLTVNGYNQGLRTQLEVTSAINERNTARYNLLSAQYDYYSALLDLSAATGTGENTLQNEARRNAQSAPAQ